MKNMDKGLSTEMVTDKSQMPQNLLPKLSAQAQKFGISMKKGFIERP